MLRELDAAGHFCEQRVIAADADGAPDALRGIGVRVPRTLRAARSGTYVLLGYLLVFMVILPVIVVCIWWRWREL